MLLDIFHYSENNTIHPKTWSIFSSLGEYMEKYDSNGIKIEHTMEMLDAAIAGRINVDTDFKLGGYEYTVTDKNKSKERQRASKHKFISYADSDVERANDLRMGGVTLDTVAYAMSQMSDAKDAIDEFFDNEELKYAIEQIKMLNEDFVLEYNIDLVVLLKRAVARVPQAVLKLKEVCKEHELVAEQIKVILSSGVPVDRCFA